MCDAVLFDVDGGMTHVVPMLVVMRGDESMGSLQTLDGMDMVHRKAAPVINDDVALWRLNDSYHRVSSQC